jgi:hypothetical protein
VHVLHVACLSYYFIYSKYNLSVSMDSKSNSSVSTFKIPHILLPSRRIACGYPSRPNPRSQLEPQHPRGTKGAGTWRLVPLRAPERGAFPFVPGLSPGLTFCTRRLQPPPSPRRFFAHVRNCAASKSSSKSGPKAFHLPKCT